MVARALLAGMAAAGIVLMSAAPVSAGSFTSPSATAQHPFVVPVDSKGNPLPFTITGSGWTPKTIVYVEVCDGKSPQGVAWMPTLDCDLATEPAGVMANASGDVTFPAANPNFQIGVFRGESPQQLFNCVAPSQTAPRDDVPTFSNCQIRMTTTFARTSETDAFLPILLPEAGGSQSATGSSPAGTSSSATTSSTLPTSSTEPAATQTPSASVRATTRSADGSLARTGARIGALVLLGLGLIAGGYGAVTLTHRRRTSPPPE